MLTFYYAPGACSLATQQALNESGLEYDAVRIDLQGDRSAYYSINPAGKVPAIVTNRQLLSENVAILQWLADCVPERQLLPTEPLERAQAMSFMAWCSNTAHLARRQAKIPRRFCEDPASHETLAAQGRKMFWDCLQQIDHRLQTGPWINGKTWSLCDSYALLFYDWAVRDEQPVSELKHFSAFAEKMLQRATVRAALVTHLSPLL